MKHAEDSEWGSRWTQCLKDTRKASLLPEANAYRGIVSALQYT